MTQAYGTARGAEAIATALFFRDISISFGISVFQTMSRVTDIVVYSQYNAKDSFLYILEMSQIIRTNTGDTTSKSLYILHGVPAGVSGLFLQCSL